jgi:hypothetical protein
MSSLFFFAIYWSLCVQILICVQFFATPMKGKSLGKIEKNNGIYDGGEGGMLFWSGCSRDGSDVYAEHTHGSISLKDKIKSLLFYQFSYLLLTYFTQFNFT